MRNLKVTALVAAALASGLLLAGIGTAMAVSRVAGTAMTLQTLFGSTEATPVVVLGSDDPTVVVTPPSGDTTEVVTPPSGDNTSSVTATDTPRPPMPPTARGHAYGRVILHPHTGLHFGWAHKPAAVTQGTQHMRANGRSASRAARGNSGHKSGSMMGR